jgi:transcriptional regulator with XRE-family HTH domain
MKENPTFRELFASARGSLPYKVERAIIGFTEQVIGKMESLALSRTELASKLESSPAYVTKFLRGGTNFTLESMIKVSEALNCDLKIELAPKLSEKDWVLVIDKIYPAQSTELKVWSLIKDVDYRRANEKPPFLGPFRPPQLIDRNEYATPTTW